MAVQCPQCGRQYDVTLFEFARSVDCECGRALDLAEGHVLRVESAGVPATPEGKATGCLPIAPRERGLEPITDATWDYLTAPHIAEDYDHYFRHNELFRFDVQVLDRWFATPGRLLDLGSGTGRHLAHFARRGFEVTGVDLSRHMLAATRCKLAEQGCQATLVHGDITRLDELRLGRFDYAVCMFSTLGMVHGAANRLRVLEAVRRHLDAGGALALHAHNRWHNLWDPDGRRYLRRAVRDWLGRRPEAFEKDMDGYRGIRHLTLYVYGARELRRVLAQAGFRVEEFLYLNQARNGALRGVARGLRCNGFIVLCRPQDRSA